MAIDLKNLIDQVLGMARESLDLRKRNAEASWYGGNKDEEEYWKEMRRRNTELELRGAEGKNRLAEREMINTGDLEKQRVADAGELARKQLDLDFDKYKLGRDIDVDIYKTETDRYLKQQELAGKGDNKAKEIEAITGALSLTDLPEQTRKALTGRLNSIYSETPAPEGGKAETPQALPTPAAPKNEPDGIIGEITKPAPVAAEPKSASIPSPTVPPATPPATPQINQNYGRMGIGATDDQSIIDAKKNKRREELNLWLTPKYQQDMIGKLAGYQSRQTGIPLDAAIKYQTGIVNADAKKWRDELNSLK